MKQPPAEGLHQLEKMTSSPGAEQRLRTTAKASGFWLWGSLVLTARCPRSERKSGPPKPRRYFILFFFFFTGVWNRGVWPVALVQARHSLVTLPLKRSLLLLCLHRNLGTWQAGLKVKSAAAAASATRVPTPGETPPNAGARLPWLIFKPDASETGRRAPS